MDREEIKIKLKDINERLINGYFKDKQQMDNLTFERERLEFGLKIYDDFESRTCKNCNYYTGKVCYYHEGWDDNVGVVHPNMKGSDGCNKFERKEK